jgi:DNA-binding transcriptional LysR family regulator
MQRIPWHLLETFRVVGRLEHVSHAASELGTSQPAVSRAIARLEGILGEPLFDRLGRSIALTKKARQFLEAVERSHEEIAETQARLFERWELDPRPVSLGFLRTLGTKFVPSLIKRFRTAHPTIELSFAQNNTVAIEGELVRGNLDIALTVLPSQHSSIQSKRLFDQELVLIAARSNRLSKKKIVRLPDVAEEPFVTFKRGHPFRALNEQICSAAGFMPRVSFEGDDSSTIPGFVAAGFGIAIVPSDINIPSDVVILPTGGPLMRRQIGVAWIGSRHLHANARHFRDFIVEDSFSHSKV